MKNYLHEAIDGYSSERKISFHMPGHKGKDFFDKNFTEFDLTEIPDMDDLYNPKGIIKNSMDRAADIYGAKKAVFLTGGSTAGILAAILSSVSRGDKILVARNCHKSVINGVFLSGALPVYLQPCITEGGLCSEVLPETVGKAFESHRDIKAVVITSPTYEGITSDISSISKTVHSYGGILIVDEAHGAHFPFSHAFPKPSIACGADHVIIGLHKTMPVFGQCSLLLTNNEGGWEKLLAMLSVVQTSSPSYMFMASADLLTERLSQGYYDFKSYVDNLCEFRKKAVLAGARMLQAEEADISKLVFFTSKPKESMNILRTRFNIEMEYRGLNHILGISSIMDTRQDFEMLLEGITGTKQLTEKEGSIKTARKPALPGLIGASVLTLEQAANTAGEKVLLENGIGGVVLDMITVYPPGIPIIMPGERMTKEVFEYLRLCLDMNMEVQGIIEGKIRRVSV